MATRQKQKRYAVQLRLYLTRDQAVAIRHRAGELGLRIRSWLERLALEELRRPARLPRKDGGQNAAS